MSGAARRVRGIVFDLDGTLIDSRRDIAEAANHALASAGLTTLPHAELESYVGDGAPLLLSRAARCRLDDPLLERLLAAFLDYYAAHPLDFTRLMPGAREALAALGGYRLAVCTNKPRLTSELVLRGLELSPLFAALVAGDDLPQRKPDPAPVRRAAELLALAPSELLMVGDGPQDILSGRAAGALSVGVRGGIQALEKLLAASPDRLIDSLLELPALVAELDAR